MCLLSDAVIAAISIWSSSSSSLTSILAKLLLADVLCAAVSFGMRRKPFAISQLVPPHSEQKKKTHFLTFHRFIRSLARIRTNERVRKMFARRLVRANIADCISFIFHHKYGFGFSRMYASRDQACFTYMLVSTATLIPHRSRFATREKIN